MDLKKSTFLHGGMCNQKNQRFRSHGNKGVAKSPQARRFI